MANIILEAKSGKLCGEHLKDALKFSYAEARRMVEAIGNNGLYWCVENLGNKNFVIVGNCSSYGNEIYITKLEFI